MESVWQRPRLWATAPERPRSGAVAHKRGSGLARQPEIAPKFCWKVAGIWGMNG
ncbi:MAG: hypothetical protein MUE85_16095 [Microscillaceae bacterium]|jgi:hypothetical protein|nr:hypothetical protein [Microscillaceae bacterium]